MVDEPTCPECGTDLDENDSCPECTGVPSVWESSALPKASSIARLIALFIDQVIAAGPMLFLGAVGWYVVADEAVPNVWSLLISIIAYALAIFWPLYYVLTRDGWGRGQGWGKRLMGLLVVREGEDAFATKGGSAVRALVLAFIAPIEAIVVLARRDGRRIGDVVAHTRVANTRDYAASAAAGAREVADHPASNTGPLIALILSSMMIASSLGLISFTVSRLAPAPVADEVAEEVYGDPGTVEARDEVERYYDDILDGSYDAAMSRMDMEQEEAFAIVSVYSDSDMLLDAHDIGDATKEGEEYVVLAQELFADDSGGTFEREVTYVLRPAEGALVITEVSATGFDPVANAESAKIYPEDGEATVESFLGFVAAGDAASARDLSTEEFIAEHPEYFDGSLGELATWEILGSEQLTSERLRVRVDEPWSSGAIVVDYQVMLEGDVLLVDAARIVE